jgi:hypothetical protein
MPSFSVPYELRDIIIELVICAVQEAPSNVTEAEKTRAPPREWSTSHILLTAFKTYIYGPSHVRFEKAAHPSNGESLLLVNHQLSFETASALARLLPQSLP